MNATWNYDQTTLLREQYGKLPAVAIASLLGKTPNAIMHKANKMGLKSKLVPHGGPLDGAHQQYLVMCWLQETEGVSS